MAKIILGIGVSSISGSIAGSTFSRNANGAYIRNKGIPTNSNTIAQQLSRARFAAAAIFWRLLTLVQQNSFRDQAINYPYIDSLGQSKTYTGNQLCMTVNNRLLSVDAPEISFMVPPVSVMPIGEVQPDVDVSLSTLTLSVQYNGGGFVVPVATKLIIEATPSLSKGVTNPKNEMYRRLAVIDAAAPTLNMAFTNVYFDAFGALPALGANVYFKATAISTQTAQYSPSLDAKAVIVP